MAHLLIVIFVVLGNAAMFLSKRARRCRVMNISTNVGVG